MIQIAIIEDNTILLNELRNLISNSPGFTCPIAVPSIGRFLEELDMKTPPQVLLLDIELNGTIGLDHMEKILQLVQGISILIHSGHTKQDYIEKALQHGAKGYLLKGGHPATLLNAITLLAEGSAYIDPKVSTHILDLFQKKHPSLKETFSACEIDGVLLKQREIEVARELIKGQQYQQIADHLYISINTVRHYIKSLYNKFGVHNKVQLINFLKDKL